ncbi:DUF6216 family protein [Buttiauxella noackiae]|uniref:DUF6216 family protein n=1 Tax=Buttiauxella noackiae TaxID=82992 RepID=UPI0028D63FE1|nr:DUF6216 family protein [Buttiauxella noackiae]
MFDLTSDVVTNIFGFIDKYTAIINHLLSLVIAILLLLALYRKSGSAYSLMERIWFIFLGGKKYSDEESNKFYDDIRDMEKFNAIFNVNAKTPSEYKKIRDWITKYDLEIKQISKIKNNITVRNLKIKKQSTCSIMLTVFIILISFVLAICSFTIADADSALVSIKSNGTYLKINTHGTSKLFHFTNNDYWILTKDTCLKIDHNPEKTKKAAVITKLEPNLIDILCQMYIKKDFKYINQTIDEQNIFWKFFALFLTLTLVSFRELFKSFHTCDARVMLLYKYRLYRKAR